MLSKTKNGYGFGSYEGIPGEKINNRKITLKEITVALCRLKGLSQIEAAHLMNCSKSNVNQLWQSLFFKTHTNDALAAVIKLIDLGIVKHLILCLLILSSGAQSINPFNDSDINRPLRAKQMRTRNGKNSKLAINNHLLLSLIGLSASELYSENDLKAMLLIQSPAELLG